MNMLKKVSVSMLGIAFMFGSAQTIFAASTVNLGSAGNFTILSKTGISTTGTTSVTGDIGLSPAAASYLTGFALTLPAANAFSTSALINGKVYAPGYADPTPANLTVAVRDMGTAYTSAMGQAPSVTELGAGNIGGLTLAPGVYKWGTGVTIPTNVTLSGSANDVWIFQIAQNLNVSSGVQIMLSGGAQASNIFWIVAGQTTIGTTAVFNGNILDQTAIVLNTGARLNGRALAQTAVTLDSNMVTAPSYTAPSIYVAPTVIVTSTPNTSSSGGTSYTYTTTTNPAVTMMPYMNSSAVTTTSASKTYNFGTITMRRGSVESAVMELQRFLNAKLGLSLVVDGSMGAKTMAGVKNWQSQNSLTADGVVGAKTRAKMYLTLGQ